MRLIDKRLTQIVAGYDEILHAETGLRHHWRGRLLAAYAQRRQHAHSPRGTLQKNRPLLTALVGLLLVLLGVALACASFVRPTLLLGCGGPLLALLGLLLIAAAGFSHFSNGKYKPGKVPRHPYRDGVFPDLRQTWMQGLSGGLKAEIPDYPGYYGAGQKDHGAEGERLFVRRLLEILDGNYFVVARSMQRRGEDVDVVLVGPKGIWVFEVKYWSGEIYWDHKNGWRRLQTYYGRGGVEVTKEGEVGEPPDQQWLRAADEVTRTLQIRLPQVLKRYPALGKVRGGIVFSMPEAVLKFQPGCPVTVGMLNNWITILQEIEPKVALDTRSALQIVEALLTRHHEIAHTDEIRSMVVYAQGVIQEAEMHLAAWIEE